MGSVFDQVHALVRMNDKPFDCLIQTEIALAGHHLINQVKLYRGGALHALFPARNGCLRDTQNIGKAGLLDVAFATPMAQATAKFTVRCCLGQGFHCA